LRGDLPSPPALREVRCGRLQLVPDDPVLLDPAVLQGVDDHGVGAEMT
jgi:hypothetical protein